MLKRSCLAITMLLGRDSVIMCIALFFLASIIVLLGDDNIADSFIPS